MVAAMTVVKTTFVQNLSDGFGGGKVPTNVP